MVPDKIPSICIGEKTVICGLVMEKSDHKGNKVKCKATLTGDIVRKKFKFNVPFVRQAEGDVAVIHQLAVNGKPYENKHKQEIIYRIEL